MIDFFNFYYLTFTICMIFQLHDLKNWFEIMTDDLKKKKRNKEEKDKKDNKTK